MEQRVKELQKEDIRRKQADEELQKSEERYRNLFENATDGIYTVDLRGRFTTGNKKAEEICGYKTLIARGGKEAIEIYKKNQDTIDIVILDMIMPGVGGGEAYDRMKEINPNIKVLLSSGYSIDGQATEILKRGCDGFIQKPFNIKQLAKRMREILDRG